MILVNVFFLLIFYWLFFMKEKLNLGFSSIYYIVFGLFYYDLIGLYFRGFEIFGLG